MKTLKNFLINEAKKFDFQKDVIDEYTIDNLKLQKKFQYKGKLETKHFKEETLREYFGKLTQWLDKNVQLIVKQAEKFGDFPDTLAIELPSGLKGDLSLDWDVYWIENKPSGSLRNVEIIVSRFCPENLSNTRYYEAKQELESYKLPEEIKF